MGLFSNQQRRRAEQSIIERSPEAMDIAAQTREPFVLRGPHRFVMGPIARKAYLAHVRATFMA